MSKIITIDFFNLNEEMKKLILEWRNSEIVKKEMINNNDILLEDHLKFIKSLINNKKKRYCLVLLNEPIGVISFVDIKDNQTEIGIYKNPDLDKKGIGTILMESIFNLAKDMGLKRLYLRVRRTNENAFYLYKKFNFNQYNEDKEYIYMDKEI
jgi:UDP-4-amino-4,6-dideoxy-N-acetyl-beta-L-altrosamine N-acetyltransferase